MFVLIGVGSGHSDIDHPAVINVLIDEPLIMPHASRTQSIGSVVVGSSYKQLIVNHARARKVCCTDIELGKAGWMYIFDQVTGVLCVSSVLEIIMLKNEKLLKIWLVGFFIYLSISMKIVMHFVMKNKF